MSDVNASAVRNKLAKTPYPLYWVDTVFDDHTGVPEMDAFMAEFAQRFGERPSVFTMMGYVGAEAVINAIQSQNDDPMAVLERVQQTKDMPTVLGPVTIDKSKYMKLPIVIKQMQPDGTAKVVKE